MFNFAHLSSGFFNRVCGIHFEKVKFFFEMDLSIFHDKMKLAAVFIDTKIAPKYAPET